MNRAFNHSTKLSSVIQPLWDTAKRDANGPPNIVLDISRSPLYTTNGGKSIPEPDIQVCTVIFSLPDPAISACGVFWPFFVKMVLGVQLRGKPDSSTLYICSGLSNRSRLRNTGSRQLVNQWSTIILLLCFALIICRCCGFRFLNSG